MFATAASGNPLALFLRSPRATALRAKEGAMAVIHVIDAQPRAAIATIAASIGHEIHDAVTALKDYAQLLRQFPENRGIVLEGAETLAAQSERITEHARNLIEIGRPTNPSLKPRRITPLLDAVVELLRLSVLRPFEIRKVYGTLLPPVVVDAAEVEHVIRALVDNAAAAMGTHGVLTLTTRLAADGAHVELCVADTGRGIPTSMQQEVFEPFVTTDPSGKSSGLGLYLAKRVAEDHGGYIRLESTPGKGTVVTVGLPSGAHRDRGYPVSRAAELWRSRN
jgi:signal transduction histidine kinase